MTDHQLGTTCARCGVRHRVLESMPNRPFDAEDVARLDRSCAFVGAVESAADGAAPTSAVLAHDSTNTLVVSTARATRLLRRTERHGWVVFRERDHGEGDAPRAVGLDVFCESGARLPPGDARTVLDVDE